MRRGYDWNVEDKYYKEDKESIRPVKEVIGYRLKEE
jgi:hypothetical protein